MIRVSDKVKNYNGENPFSDSQPRNFSDDKVINEFYPTSIFWSLFNDQHEIIVGTRGSGKTFLLKMMRYSMLKKIPDIRAQKIIKEKNFISLYVPMNIEFVGSFSYRNIPEDYQIPFFQFSFNCLLAESLITELLSILDEEQSDFVRFKKNNLLANNINSIWFNDQSNTTDMSSLATKVRTLFYNNDIKKGLEFVPPVFTKQIGSSMQSVKDVIQQIFNFEEEPTWIICVDEAEFLKSPLQKCINTVFRSDSKRLVLKVATLPFYHKTYKTLDNDISVSVGNDFNFRFIDMKYDSEDFIQVTNSLCNRRLKRLNAEIYIDKLEEFIGTIGNDDLIDYYREEVGPEKSQMEIIEKEIISEFSAQRKLSVSELVTLRKPVYDKFAPIFFLRKMYHLSTEGHSVPGWYSGSSMIRKISQGNPRRFIQLMNDIFEKARTTTLKPKSQHEVIMKYARTICDATQSLEIHGPKAKDNLDQIAEYLKSRVHNGPLIFAGNTFSLNLNNEELKSNEDWIKLAVAYSRLVVDDSSLLYGISNDTKYSIGNVYSAKYWLPMRVGDYPKIKLSSKDKYSYQVGRIKAKESNKQISLFDEVKENDTF